MPDTSRLRLYGAAVVAALVLLGALGVAQYDGAFDNDLHVTIHTDRSGLLLEPGNDVALRGADIGRVLGVSDDHGQVTVTVALERDRATFVPSDATASIAAPTVLGPKFVDLVSKPGIPRHPITDGAILASSSVGVEVNEAFNNLMSVLNTVQPSQINSALGALSTTLQGRGQPLGEYLSQINSYLTKFNGSLPQLDRDVQAAPPVTNTYRGAGPDLTRLLDNLTTTGRTVSERQPSIDAFLMSLQGLSDNTRGFLTDNKDELTTALDTLRPTTQLADRYSPMFPCLFSTLNHYRRSVEPASGGIYPGLYTRTTVIPGKDGYRAPQNLPKVAADAPGCAGGPVQGEYRRAHFNDGSPDLDTKSTPTTQLNGDLALQLFGRKLPVTNGGGP